MKDWDKDISTRRVRYSYVQAAVSPWSIWIGQEWNMYFTRHTINFTECSRVITILMGLFKALYHCHLYIFLNFIGWGGWVDLWKFDPLWQPGHWSVFHTQVAIKAGWPLVTLQVACFISLETQNLLPDQGKTTARLKTVRDSFIKPRNSINCCLCMVMQSLQFRNVMNPQWLEHCWC